MRGNLSLQAGVSYAFLLLARLTFRLPRSRLGTIDASIASALAARSVDFALFLGFPPSSSSLGIAGASSASALAARLVGFAFLLLARDSWSKLRSPLARSSVCTSAMQKLLFSLHSACRHLVFRSLIRTFDFLSKVLSLGKTQINLASPYSFAPQQCKNCFFHCIRLVVIWYFARLFVPLTFCRRYSRSEKLK